MKDHYFGNGDLLLRTAGLAFTLEPLGNQPIVFLDAGRRAVLSEIDFPPVDDNQGITASCVFAVFGYAFRGVVRYYATFLH